MELELELGYVRGKVRVRVGLVLGRIAVVMMVMITIYRPSFL